MDIVVTRYPCSTG